MIVFLLRMDKSIIDDCLSKLKKYAVFFKVELHNISNQFDIIFGCQLPVEYPIQHFAVETDQPLLQEIWVKKAGSNLDNNLQPPQTQEWLDLQLIRCGLFDITSNWIEQWLPHNMGLQRELPKVQPAISYSKGCYTGQEIVARTHYLGNVKKALHFKVLNSSNIAEGDNMLNDEGKATGKVVKCAASERGMEILMIGSNAS